MLFALDINVISFVINPNDKLGKIEIKIPILNTINNDIIIAIFIISLEFLFLIEKDFWIDNVIADVEKAYIGKNIIPPILSSKL